MSLVMSRARWMVNYTMAQPNRWQYEQSLSQTGTVVRKSHPKNYQTA